MKRHTLFLVAILVISSMFGGCTSMQSKEVTALAKYPDKPITCIVPFGAGGALDLVARMLDKTAAKHLGQPLVIINKPGSAGAIGWNELVNAAPDGYTMGISSSDIFLHPLYNSTKYNYPTALEPLAQVTSTPFVMAVQANKQWKSTAELISYSKQHPDELKFGHTGIGSHSHVLGETFSKSADITLKQVPYRSAAEAVASLLGGHVQVIFINPGSVKEYMKAGTIRILAVTSNNCLTDPVFADVPTFKEAGFAIFSSGRFNIVVPKELPTTIKVKLAQGLKAIITDPEFKRDIENMGLQYEYLDSEQSQKQWLIENKELTKAVREAGIIELIKSQKQ